MPVCCSLDQLAGNTNAATRFPDASFEHIAHAEFATDLLDVDRLALVGEARIAGDHEQRLEPRQRGDDIFHHAIGEVFLLRIAAHVLEWQHGDRGLVGKLQGFLDFDGRRRGGRRRRHAGRMHRINANGPRDILDLLFAAILERRLDLTVDFAVDFPRYQNTPGIAEGFQPCGHIDAFTVDVAALLHDDIAKIETDAHPEWAGIVAQTVLDGDRAPQGRDRAGELGQKAVAGGLDQPSIVFGKARLDQLAPQPANAGIRAFFVALHQRRKPDDVRGQDGRQPPLNLLVDQRFLLSEDIAHQTMMRGGRARPNVSNETGNVPPNSTYRATLLVNIGQI